MLQEYVSGYMYLGTCPLVYGEIFPVLAPGDMFLLLGDMYLDIEPALFWGTCPRVSG